MESTRAISFDELAEMSYKVGSNGFLFTTMTRGELAHCVIIAYESVSCDTTSMDPDEKFSKILSILVKTIYSLHNGKYYFDMRDSIVDFYSNNQVQKEHILEAFSAFEAKMYYASLMAALPFVESLICTNTNSTSVLKNYASRNTPSLLGDDLEMKLQYSNIKGFLDTFFKFAPFSSTEPFILNRHWYAHGRSNRPVSDVDCYTVFSTIKNLIDLLYTRQSINS